MPRFLNTETGFFVWKNSAKTTTYAILSHTWRSEAEGGEQTYEDVRKIQESVRSSEGPGEEPRSVLDHPDISDKIKEACRLACDSGFLLMWIDSCCIDKSSSAELSEAINSMYEWYRLSDVCYVYLVDVEEKADFENSRWHKRGWTLQELIAPGSVFFFSADWCLVGTKMSLAAQLSLLTGIDHDLLLGDAPLSSISVARRLSWAANRETTRVEDRAYSLLGIFGVHLSPIYGEGTNAFVRLQEEIIKTIPDQSIFAWGHSCVLQSPGWAVTRKPAIVTGNSACHLLASSPDSFRDTANITPLSPSKFAARLGRIGQSLTPPSLHCIFTPEGVQIDVVCVDFLQTHPLPDAIDPTEATNPTEFRICRECLALGRAHQLALLRCQDEDGSLVALPLCRPSEGEVQRTIVLGLSGLCCTCAVSNLLGQYPPYRTVRITQGAMEALRDHTLPAPITVFLLRSIPLGPFSKSAHSDFALPEGNFINLWNVPGKVDASPENCVQFLIPAWTRAAILSSGGFLTDFRVERPPTKQTVILTAHLSINFGRMLPIPSRRRWGEQCLFIELALVRVPRAYVIVTGEDTFAKFSVKNVFSTIHEQSPLPDPVDGQPPQTPPPIPEHSHIHDIEAPWPDKSDGTYTTQFHSVGTTRRVLAKADFICHAAHDDWDKEESLVRSLRITLERTNVSATVVDTKTAWFCVEMSDEYIMSAAPDDYEALLAARRSFSVTEVFVISYPAASRTNVAPGRSNVVRAGNIPDQSTFPQEKPRVAHSATKAATSSHGRSASSHTQATPSLGSHSASAPRDDSALAKDNGLTASFEYASSSNSSRPAIDSTTAVESSSSSSSPRTGSGTTMYLVRRLGARYPSTLSLLPPGQ